MSTEILELFPHVYVPGTSGRTLLALHGTGGNERDLLPLARALDSNAGILSPRGRVLENGMPRYFRRLAEGVFDEQDLVLRAGELADFVAAAAEAYHFDAGRVVAAGYSNGANIAGALLLLHPRVLAGAALLRPMTPIFPDTPPDLAGRPVLVSSGRHDPIVPSSDVERLVSLLRQSGADVTVRVEDAAHGLTDLSVESARQWLRELSV